MKRQFILSGVRGWMEDLIIHTWELGTAEQALLELVMPPLGRLVVLPPGAQGLGEVLPLGGSVLVTPAQTDAGRALLRRALRPTCAVVLELAYEPATRLAAAADGYRHFVVPADSPGELAAALVMGQEVRELLGRAEQVSLPLPVGALLPDLAAGPVFSDAFAREASSQLARLLRVISAFRLAGGQEEVYQRLTEALCEHFPFRRSVLLLLEGNRLPPRAVCWPDGDAEALARGLAVDPPRLDPLSPEYESFALGRAFVVDTEQCGLWSPAAREALGRGETALTPLFTDREFIGVLVADPAGDSRVMTDADLSLLESCGILVGALLHNYWLYSELEEKHRDLELKVRELSMVGELTRIINRALGPEEAVFQMLALVARLLAGDFAFLFLYDEDRAALRLFGSAGLDRGLSEAWRELPGLGPDDLAIDADAGRLLRRGKSPAGFWLPGLSGPAAVHVLRVRGRVGGVWGLGRRPGARPFSAGEEQIVATADEHMSVALSSLRLRHLAATDHLTGLFTRRYFLEALDQELRLASYLGHPLTLVMLDVDRFKTVNDTHGHPAGDAVLEGLARVLSGGMRDSDTCGRVGGEEFAVLLPRCGEERGWRLAERLRQAASDLVVDYLGASLGVTISLGLATMSPGLPVSREELIRRADAALYRSKADGRNRTTAWRPDLPPMPNGLQTGL